MVQNSFLINAHMARRRALPESKRAETAQADAESAALAVVGVDIEAAAAAAQRLLQSIAPSVVAADSCGCG